MNKFGFLVLFGLLAIGHAKPEGYSYQGPQILPQAANLPQFNGLNDHALQGLALNQGQQSSSFQQSLPNIQQSQPLQQLTINQGQQTSSFQQSLPVSQQISQPSQEYLTQSKQGYSYPQPQLLVQNPQPQLNVQIPQPQFNVVQLPQPQQQLNVHIPVPQGNINNFQSSLQQSLPQIPIQPQVNYNQVEQTNSFQQLPQFNPQPSFQNALPQHNIGQNLLGNSQGPQHESLGGFSGLGQNNYPVVSSQQPASLVTKHISIHVAPEEPEEFPQVQAQPLPAKKNYKIIFIKAPTVGLTQNQIVAQQAAQQVEEKTLVYVLVNKPQVPELVLPSAAPAPVSKPEVYFIKYKSNSNGNGPSLIESGDGNLGGSSSGPSGAGLPIVEDIAKAQGQVPINSGESTSSLFSGGLPGPKGPSPQYGVPGYQKRSTQK